MNWQWVGILCKKIWEIILEESTQQVYKSNTKVACTKINVILFWSKCFEQQCVLLNLFLNQGELAVHCSFIGINHAYFNSQFLFNAKQIFSETLSPKKRGQASFDKKGYQDTVLVSFTTTLPNITTDINTMEKYLLHNQVKGKKNHKITLMVWCYLLENSWCWNETSGTES